MLYKTRTGVVLTSIHGEYLLVSAKKARAFCPYVTQINATAAFLWKQLENGADIDSCVQALCGEYEIEDMDEAVLTVRQFIDAMLQAGYLREDDAKEI